MMKIHRPLRPTDLVRREAAALRRAAAVLGTAAIERRAEAGRREVRAYALHIKATGDDGSVEGYGSVFGVRDAYADVIAAGAFAASIKAHKAANTMPAMLWQHDAAQPIGVWTDMVEDDKGLRVVGKLALDTMRGKEAHALLKIGALNGLSIGFVSKQWAYDRDSEVRTLTEIDLWEVSLVTFPANEKARVTNVKATPDELATPKDAERTLRDAGFSKSDATAFVSRVMRMGEERSESADSTAKALSAAQRLLSTLTS
jgi:HK97 family phage prohead protease